MRGRMRRYGDCFCDSRCARRSLRMASRSAGLSVPSPSVSYFFTSSARRASWSALMAARSSGSMVPLWLVSYFSSSLAWRAGRCASQSFFMAAFSSGSRTPLWFASYFSSRAALSMWCRRWPPKPPRSPSSARAIVMPATAVAAARTAMPAIVLFMTPPGRPNGPGAAVMELDRLPARRLKGPRASDQVLRRLDGTSRRPGSGRRDPCRLLVRARPSHEQLVGAEGRLVAHRRAPEHPVAEVDVGDAALPRQLDAQHHVGHPRRAAAEVGVVEGIDGAPGALGDVAQAHGHQPVAVVKAQLARGGVGVGELRPVIVGVEGGRRPSAALLAPGVPTRNQGQARSIHAWARHLHAHPPDPPQSPPLAPAGRERRDRNAEGHALEAAGARGPEV